jgi:hypothetical protein
MDNEVLDFQPLILQFNIEYSNIFIGKPTRPGIVVSDSIKYLYLKFKFSDDWLPNKYIQFRYTNNANEIPTESLLINDGCFVPFEYIKFPQFFFSLYCVGSDKGMRITTEMCRISVLQSGYSYKSKSPADGIGIGTSPVHSPSGDGRILLIRENDEIFEYSIDGIEWIQIQGVGGTVMVQGF